MRTVKAVYDHGKVTLLEPVEIDGPVEGVLVLPDLEAWDEIIRDPSSRPGLSQKADDVLKRFHSGETQPLDPSKL